MSRSLQTHSFSTPASRSLDSNARSTNARTSGLCYTNSRIAALSIEFVAKPNEAHKIHAALPAAIQSALGEVDGFAGSFVLIANHEARLVTVVTLWTGEDRLQRCGENLRWVRALLAPYLDRCLRVQTLSAFAPAAAFAAQPFRMAATEKGYESSRSQPPFACGESQIPLEPVLREEAALCVA